MFSHGLVGIYNLSPEASVISRQMITAHSFAMIIWPLAFTIPHALRASLDAKFTMCVSVFSMWMFRIAFAYLFVRAVSYTHLPGNLLSVRMEDGTVVEVIRFTRNQFRGNQMWFIP